CAAGRGGRAATQRHRRRRGAHDGGALRRQRDGGVVRLLGAASPRVPRLRSAVFPGARRRTARPTGGERRAASLAGPGEDPPALAPDERFSRRASFTTPVGLETTALLTLGIGAAVAAAATMV